MVSGQSWHQSLARTALADLLKVAEMADWVDLADPVGPVAERVVVEVEWEALAAVEEVEAARAQPAPDINTPSTSAYRR